MILPLLTTLIAPPAFVTPSVGLVVTRSSVFKAGLYRLANDKDDASGAAIVVRGSNIVLDFRGATLEGCALTSEPDQRKGTAMRIEGHNVTVRNLKARGYRIALFAVKAKGLKLENCDFSDNYRPQLRSGLERESYADWMSYHDNEKREWLRFGAGVYLEGTDDFRIDGLRINNTQCGLMLTRSNGGVIVNSNLSFNSGLGIGLYRSSANRIIGNKVDWCVRGYSHGVYNRGQDSAGILIYEQSSHNVIAYNSVTHGGDGLFLWAGNQTMNTGEGGCNDNLVFGNDFSHSPTNGIEATFSRNDFVNNKLYECWHALWGGYSFDSRFVGNDLGYNGEAIAIEHGRNFIIRSNTFSNDHGGLALWTNTNDLNGGMSRFRRTNSANYLIINNTFTGLTGAVLTVRQASDIVFANNTVEASARVFDFQAERVSVRRDLAYAPGTTPGFIVRSNTLVGPVETLPPDLGQTPVFSPSSKSPGPQTIDIVGNSLIDGDWQIAPYLAHFSSNWNPWPGKASTPDRRELETYAPARPAGGQDPFLKPGALRGRRFILVTTWGPYDFRYPILWPRDINGVRRTQPAKEGVLTFEILGPEGRWRVGKTDGVQSVSANSGTLPAILEVRPKSGESYSIELIYEGAQTVDYRGVVTPAGQAVRFGYPSPLIRLQPEPRRRQD